MAELRSRVSSPGTESVSSGHSYDLINVAQGSFAVCGDVQGNVVFKIERAYFYADPKGSPYMHVYEPFEPAIESSSAENEESDEEILQLRRPVRRETWDDLCDRFQGLQVNDGGFVKYNGLMRDFGQRVYGLDMGDRAVQSPRAFADAQRLYRASAQGNIKRALSIIDPTEQRLMCDLMKATEGCLDIIMLAEPDEWIKPSGLSAISISGLINSPYQTFDKGLFDNIASELMNGQPFDMGRLSLPDFTDLVCWVNNCFGGDIDLANGMYLFTLMYRFATKHLPQTHPVVRLISTLYEAREYTSRVTWYYAHLCDSIDPYMDQVSAETSFETRITTYANFLSSETDHKDMKGYVEEDKLVMRLELAMASAATPSATLRSTADEIDVLSLNLGRWQVANAQRRYGDPERAKEQYHAIRYAYSATNTIVNERVRAMATNMIGLLYFDDGDLEAAEHYLSDGLRWVSNVADDGSPWIENTLIGYMKVLATMERWEVMMAIADRFPNSYATTYSRLVMLGRIPADLTLQLLTDTSLSSVQEICEE